MVANYSEDSESRLLSFKKTLSEKLALMENLDTEIFDTIEDEDLMINEIQTAGDFKDDMQEKVLQRERRNLTLKKQCLLHHLV